MRIVPAAITPLYFSDFIKSIFSRGKGVKKFELNLSKYFSCKHAFTFGSLMRSVYACFMVLKFNNKRKKVVIPRYSCPSFYHGITAAGLEVEYCDINPKTLSINLKSLNKINLNEVLAVVCTNLFGFSSEINKIKKICKSSRIYLVEGADYSFGTEFKKKKIGTWGDVVILNFQEGKAIPVGGGAIVTNLDIFKKFYKKKRSKKKANYLTIFGFILFSKPHMYGFFRKILSLLKINPKIFSMEDTLRKSLNEIDFKFNSLDFDKSISDFQGNLANIILQRIENDISIRFKNSLILSKILKNTKGIQIIKKYKLVNKIHFIRYPILVSHNKRDLILSSLLKNGIEASPMYSEHNMKIESSDFLGSRKVLNELMTLPCHPFMLKKDFYLIKKVFKNHLN